MSDAPPPSSPAPQPEIPSLPDAGPHAAPPTPSPADVAWQRLDPRTLVIAPLGMIKEAALPAVVAVFGASRAGAGPLWWAVVTAAVLLIGGLVPWLTTRYRVTATHLEIRRAFIGTTVKTTPIERIRTVDLESSLLHRLLGVTKVKIGTGEGGDGALGLDSGRLSLSALSHDQAEALRALLRHRSPAAVAAADPEARSATDIPEVATAPQELARLDWSWLRFAPFSLSRMVIVVSALGVMLQFGDDLPFFDWEHIDRAGRAALELALPVLGALLLMAALIGWLIISVGGYAVQWFGYRLTRGDGNLHRTSGMFTTKSITVEEARVRGAVFNETLLLRLVHGAEASVLASGLGAGGSTPLVPPAPRGVAQRVARLVLGTNEPFEVVATRHGPASRRRTHLRAQWATLVSAVSLAVWVRYGEWLAPWHAAVIVTGLAGFAALLAESTYRHRGHGLSSAYLISDSGVTTRRRTVLQREGIIGWVIQETFFQRRLGLCTLVATTACNEGQVVVRDLPKAVAEQLSAEATPATLADFVSVG